MEMRCYNAQGRAGADRGAGAAQLGAAGHVVRGERVPGGEGPGPMYGIL